MAASEEEFILKAAGAGGAEIPLHDPDWSIQQLDLGTAGSRDELITSADSDGAAPARVARKEPVEWSARIRLAPQPSMDAAVALIRQLETALAAAERVAADGYTDPGVDPVRLLWRPKGTDLVGTMPLIRAEITGVPKEVSGDDIGWWLHTPVITIGGLRDPWIYGPLKQLKQEAVTGDPWGQVVEVSAAGGAGPPWVRLEVLEQESIARNLVTVGVESPASTDPLVIPAASLVRTGFQGTLSGSRLTCSSSQWVGAASTGPLGHRGSYRVIACAARGTGSIRLRYGVTGQPQQLQRVIPVDGTLMQDLDLGPIVVDRDSGGSWTGIIETTGTVSLGALRIDPTDTYIHAATEPGTSALGTMVVDGGMAGSGALHGSALAMPSGQSWSVLDGSAWTRSSGLVQRTAVSEPARRIALAGSSTYAGVAVFAEFTAQNNQTADLLSEMGLVLRYVDANNYAVARLARAWDPGYTPGYLLVLELRVDGNLISLHNFAASLKDPGWAYFFGASAGFNWVGVGCSIDTQGRWQLYARTRPGDITEPLLVAGGQHPALAAGGPLAAGRIGLLDRWSQATAMTRQITQFRAFGSPLAQTPVLPAGKSIELTPAQMVAIDGATRTRINHRGGTIAPDPQSPWRMLVASRRYPGIASTEAEAKTDNQRVTVSARQRCLQVPGT